MGFFISLKGYKSNNVFINFCYNFYKDDFCIFIPVKLLKVGLNKLNVSEKVILKSSFYRLKDRQRSGVLEGVNTGNNGFEDLSFWESIEGGLCMPEDKSYKFVESQEVTIGPEQTLINGLNLETSRGTVKKRLRILVEPQDIEETDDMRRNLKGYNALL